MSDTQTPKDKAGVIGRTLRLMLGTLLCWMTYTVMSGETTPFNLGVLWVFGGIVISYLVVHVVIHRYLPTLNRWWGALYVLVPVFGLFVFGGQASRVAIVGYVGVAMILLAAKGSMKNGMLFLPAVLSGKETHIACLLFAPIDLIEEHLGGPGGMPG